MTIGAQLICPQRLVQLGNLGQSLMTADEQDAMLMPTVAQYAELTCWQQHRR
jgi:hypothetical protein